MSRDGTFIITLAKTVNSFSLFGISGGFNSEEDFLAAVEQFLESTFYGPTYRVEAYRGCMGLPSIYDEITATEEEPADIDLTKQLPADKITSVAEPINIANGEMFTTDVDIRLSGKGFGLKLSRKYQSQSEYDGPFGYGWRSSYDIRLSEDADGNVLEVDDQGVHTIYTLETDSSYTPSVGKYSQLVKNSDNTYTITRKHGTVYRFDTEGKLIEIVDRNNNYTSIAYDANGIISYVIDASGRELRFTPNANGKIVAAEDPAQRVFHYQYGTEGNLTKVIDPLGNETIYHYDSEHNLIQKIDANNHSLYFEYDANDRAYHSWQDGGNNEVNLAFDLDNNITVSTDSRGNSTTYEFNDYGLVTKITDSLGGVQEFIWDDNFNKTSTTDQNGHTNIFTYNLQGDLLSAKDALGNITTFIYTSDFHFLETLTDSLGNTTEYSYDSSGNLIQLTDALGNNTDYVYDLAGQPTQTKDANNNITYFSYDSHGNLIKIKDAQANETQFEYDILGNLLKTIDALGNSTTFSYDILNRLIQTVYPDNSIAAISYDPVGNVLTTTDPNGNITSYAYDEVNRRTQLTDALGNNTTFSYDTEGNRLSLNDANGSTTQYEYDGLNRLITTTDQQANQAHFVYDNVGSLISKTDANGSTITYSYDALNRLIKKQYPDSNQETFTYDSEGRMLTAVNQYISYTYTYDPLGRILETTDSNQRSFSYEYDPVGNKISMTGPEDIATAYSYDSLNRLSAITDAQDYTTTYSYDRLGRRLQTILANGSITSYEYDTVGNLLNISNICSDNKVISDYSYEYDMAGNRLSKAQTNLNTAYTYDNLYRLTQSLPTKIKINGSNKLQLKKSENYSYDPLGNRLTSGKDTYSYNQLNQLLSSNKYTYEYDQNGNRTKRIKTKEDGSQNITTYSYDYENRLSQVTIEEDGKEAVKVIAYAYDPFGRRIEKTFQKLKNDEIKQSYIITYVYDNEDIVLESKQKGDNPKQKLISYTHGPGIDEPLSIAYGNKTYFYHYDALGSAAALTNRKQKTVESYSYDSFGNLKRKGKKTKNNHTFTGREFDKKTGLYYYRNRYYDPKVGRFLQSDPLGVVDGPNLYTYVGNNPVNYVDPWGLCGEEKWAPLWIEIFVPGYRKYGGPSRIGPGEPEDIMDAMYQRHDTGYGQGDRHKADIKLIIELSSLPINPYKWGEGVNPVYAVLYRTGATTFFSTKILIDISKEILGDFLK